MGKAVKELIEGLGEAELYLKGQKNLKSNILRIRPVPNLKAKDIVRIRKRMGASQVTFAELLGAHRRTIEAWESGENKPSGPAARLLQLLDEDLSIAGNHLVLEGNKKS